MEQNPTELWRAVLNGCATKRIFAFDLDGTLWLPDTLAGLNDWVGPTDPSSGEKSWKVHYSSYKAGELTVVEFLLALYKEVFLVKSMDEVLDWLRANLKLVDHAPQTIAFLKSMGITPVAISNGSRQINEPLLQHFNVQMALVCNELVVDNGGQVVALTGFHNQDQGVQKGELIKLAASWGYEVVGCAGDSLGDRAMAEETAKAGGIVFAAESGGLSDWCLENLSDNGWLTYRTFRDVTLPLQQRLGGS